VQHFVLGIEMITGPVFEVLDVVVVTPVEQKWHFSSSGSL
jgi:hypothetical protein